MKESEEKKQRIVEGLLEALNVCIEEMQSPDEKIAKNADVRFGILAQGLYNYLKYF